MIQLAACLGLVPDEALLQNSSLPVGHPLKHRHRRQTAPTHFRNDVVSALGVLAVPNATAVVAQLILQSSQVRFWEIAVVADPSFNISTLATFFP